MIKQQTEHLGWGRIVALLLCLCLPIITSISHLCAMARNRQLQLLYGDLKRVFEKRGSAQTHNLALRVVRSSTKLFGRIKG